MRRTRSQVGGLLWRVSVVGLWVGDAMAGRQRTRSRSSRMGSRGGFGAGAVGGGGRRTGAGVKRLRWRVGCLCQAAGAERRAAGAVGGRRGGGQPVPCTVRPKGNSGLDASAENRHADRGGCWANPGPGQCYLPACGAVGGGASSCELSGRPADFRWCPSTPAITTPTPRQVTNLPTSHNPKEGSHRGTNSSPGADTGGRSGQWWLGPVRNPTVLPADEPVRLFVRWIGGSPLLREDPHCFSGRAIGNNR